MKKIFAKPHSLLFAASAVMLLQFLTAVCCFFIQSVYYDFSSWTSSVYAVYCALACIISGIIILKKPDNNIKMLFAGVFLYFFAELLFYLKALYISNSEFSFFTDSVYNLWDNQPLYRLILSSSVIFLICGSMYFTEKKKIYAVFAGVNLIIFALVFFFMPGGESLLLDADASIFEVAFIEIIREAGLLIYMINMFALGLYRLWLYEEK